MTNVSNEQEGVKLDFPIHNKCEEEIKGGAM